MRVLFRVAVQHCPSAECLSSKVFESICGSSVSSGAAAGFSFACFYGLGSFYCVVTTFAKTDPLLDMYSFWADIILIYFDSSEVFCFSGHENSFWYYDTYFVLTRPACLAGLG